MAIDVDDDADADDGSSTLPAPEHVAIKAMKLKAIFIVEVNSSSQI